MQNSFSESYKAAGVDVTAGYRAVELMKAHVARTKIPGVLDEIGGFGGMLELPEGMRRPVLVSGTDGVGTKLRLAFLKGQHNTVGIDCVAMCVNDIICCGAKPLVFLDYLALGKNIPEQVAEIVAGVAEGCVQAGCALVGGETAEMPGFYPEGEYDLAGFSVGVVERDAIIDRTKVQAGNVILGLRSSGVHSNGFSLVRKVFGIDSLNADRDEPGLADTLLGTLLIPTRIYVKPMLALFSKVAVRSVAHITGGGFYENIPRALPDGFDAVITRERVPVLPVFTRIQVLGNIPERDMFNTFNMGIGMMVVVDEQDADTALSTLKAAGEDAVVLGTVQPGTGTVRFI